VAEEDALNGAFPTEEKSDCLEAGPTMNSKLKELMPHEGIIFWSDIGENVLLKIRFSWYSLSLQYRIIFLF